MICQHCRLPLFEVGPNYWSHVGGVIRCNPDLSGLPWGIVAQPEPFLVLTRDPDTALWYIEIVDPVIGAREGFHARTRFWGRIRGQRVLRRYIEKRVRLVAAAR